MKTEKRKSSARGWLIAAAAVCMALSALAVLTTGWAMRTWPNLSMDEMVYHLSNPITGTDRGLIISFVLQSALPSLAAASLAGFGAARLRRRGRTLLIGLAVLVLSVSGSLWQLDRHVGVVKWLKAQSENSDFIAENYVDPAQTEITFPQEKRNLVFIFLESMETTYADAASGGAMDVNYIPELTRLAQENEDFSGSSDQLNGGFAPNGTTWTMGAMFGHTAALPLKISVGGNDMYMQKQFFPGISTMGDVLQQAGYRQVLLIGSDAVFGGRELYFTDHGDYTIYDHPYAAQSGWIPENYHVFWGYEDEKLFAFAREQLNAMSQQEAPFNLTLLTVDTHFEDGYVCVRCGDKYGTDQYANVLACSSCQVAEFVSWIQAQDFYENTAVVLVGDHLTMDSDFCLNLPEGYPRRTYTAYINAAAEVENPAQRRAFSTLDTFPTTLAALGAHINGDRLGLGVNLFSQQPTLLEQYGMDVVVAEFLKASDFMAEKAMISEVTLSANDEKNNDITLQIKAHMKGKKLEIVWEREDSEKVLYSKKVRSNVQQITRRLQLPEDYAMHHRLVVRLVSEDDVRELYAVRGLPLEMIDDMDGYLEVLAAERERYCVLMAVRDEATYGLKPSTVQKMHELGLATDLTGQFRMCYCAAALPGQVLEKLDAEQITMTGEVPDGKTWKMTSATYLVGNTASIQIDGREYAVNARGLNFVVYDLIDGCVADSVCFDTHGDGTSRRN